MIADVKSSDGSAVILEYWFTNLYEKNKPQGKRGVTLGVFPKHGRIEYTLKKGDFWVNQGRDPIEIRGVYHYIRDESGEIVAPCYEKNGVRINYYLFFRGNPMTEKTRYDSEIDMNSLL